MALHRRRLPFRTVNRQGESGYIPDMQRHHLLPCALLSRQCFGRMFDALGPDRLGFDDFRCNGLLLPATGKGALRMRLPLHRGPHRVYTGLVEERVGRIEHDWARSSFRASHAARCEALMRLDLLRRALRRRLLMPAGWRMRLNSRDPLGTGVDFANLDTMADTLWAATSERLPGG